MEVAEAKIKSVIAILVLSVLSGCGPRFSWEKHIVDGRVTGVVAASEGDVPTAIGTVDGDCYTSPFGKTFRGGATSAVAADLIAAQPYMKGLKTVVAYSENGMAKTKPESALSNFLVDNMMSAVSKVTGRKVDIGILNFGGIRVDIPKGDVLKDDIVSMMPFRNNIAYVLLKGEDVLEIFRFLASEGIQVVGGVKFAVRDGEVDELLIGGEALDTEKLYGVATVDFLLDGGDGLKIARNAKELILTESIIGDVIMNCVLELASEGRTLDYHTDGRVVVR